MTVRRRWAEQLRVGRGMAVKKKKEGGVAPNQKVSQRALFTPDKLSSSNWTEWSVVPEEPEDA